MLHRAFLRDLRNNENKLASIVMTIEGSAQEFVMGLFDGRILIGKLDAAGPTGDRT